MPMHAHYKNASYPSLTSFILSSAALIFILSIFAWLILLVSLYVMHFYASNFQVENGLAFLTHETERFIASSHFILGKTLLAFSNQMQLKIDEGAAWVISEVNHLISSYQANVVQWNVAVLGLALNNIWQSFFIIVLRLSALILFVPLLGITSVLCVIDGLVARDIRKFQAAMESTFFHHRMKRAGKSFLLFLLFVYLASPFYVSPWMYSIPMLVTTGLFIHLACGSFKKYV